jgi:DtxR family Mn-dependent transcriptional regulator
VDESQPDRLRYIASIGLTPGAVVSVVGRQPFRGPITIEIDGRTHVIGHELGQVLFCTAEAADPSLRPG